MGRKRPLAFIWPSRPATRAPDITLFCCEHLSREVLWKAERVAHPNGAKGIARLIAVETNPTDFQYLFQTVTGDRDLRTTSFGIEMDLPNALVNVVTPAGLSCDDRKDAGTARSRPADRSGGNAVRRSECAHASILPGLRSPLRSMATRW
jgi:hypothetical protein